LVVNGLENAKARSQESDRLMRWGFREFENYALFEAGENVDNAEIWLGDQPGVGLALGETPLTITVPRGSRKGMKVKVVYDGPVPAPVKKGDELAKLVVTVPDSEPIERPLYAMADVGQLGLVGRFSSALRYLIFGAGSE
jgi:D-alanyl-D-alanine carboxypeptidase (penicillin-binding protein 5/6)